LEIRKKTRPPQFFDKKNEIEKKRMKKNGNAL